MDIDNILELREDSFYLYYEDELVRNFNTFLNSFKEFYSNVEIAYSYKTNYLPNLCKKIFHLGGIAEVVSEMELDLALKLADNNRIIYNGPYKSEQSLIKSIENIKIETNQSILVMNDDKDEDDDDENTLSSASDVSQQPRNQNRFCFDNDSSDESDDNSD